MQLILVCVLALLFAGCNTRSQGKRDPAIATAFAGPVSLPLRAEVNPKSKTVSTVSHGDKLEVLQVRRRFVRVRGPKGEEGWTEVRNLLGPEQMDALNELAVRAAKLPSQGAATVYTPLNIHTEPNRVSTSFYRITEGVKVDVVGHQLVPKKNGPEPASFQVPKPPSPVRKSREKREAKVPPPPRPAAPAVPSNWRELSKTPLPEPPPEALIAQTKPEPKVQLEDWSFVRTNDGKAGWVVTRNLVMAIPDEVAQYSEGARISSYFALGDVQDGDQIKHHWLWTTARDVGMPYDFDSFRVFIYMLRRHRYETAYIERRVIGYYPVMAKQGRFALILRNEDGTLVEKTYQLEGYQVHKIGEQPYDMKTGTPGATLAGKPQPDETPEGPEETTGETKQKPSLLDRIKGLFGRKS